MKNVTLLMIGTLAALAMLSVGVFGVPIQQASAFDGDGDGDTTNSNNDVDIDQSNKCDHGASCTNGGNTVTIGGESLECIICLDRGIK